MTVALFSSVLTPVWKYFLQSITTTSCFDSLVMGKCLIHHRKPRQIHSGVIEGRDHASYGVPAVLMKSHPVPDPPAGFATDRRLLCDAWYYWSTHLRNYPHLGTAFLYVLGVRVIEYVVLLAQLPEALPSFLSSAEPVRPPAAVLHSFISKMNIRQHAISSSEADAYYLERMFQLEGGK